MDLTSLQSINGSDSIGFNFNNLESPIAYNHYRDECSLRPCGPEAGCLNTNQGHQCICTHDLRPEDPILGCDRGKQANSLGTSKYSKIRAEPIKQYDTEQPKSYYKMVKLYLNSLPASQWPFLSQTTARQWGYLISLQVIGINTLGTMFKKIFNQAGISDDRTISNHGLRATAATTLFENGFSQRTISIRTGHQSSVVNNYIRDSTSTHIAISKCLEPIVGKIDSNQNKQLESKPEDELNITENNVSDSESPIVLEFSRGAKRLKVTL